MNILNNTNNNILANFTAQVNETIDEDGKKLENETKKLHNKEIEQSIGKNIKYLLYTNCIGYHSGYDCDTQEHIYIGDLSESRSIKKLQNGKN